MRRLVYNEYKKLLLKRSLLIIIVLFSVFNVINIKSVYKQNAYFETDMKGLDNLYWEMYPDYNGVISEEKINNIMALYLPLVEKTADRTATTRTDYPGTMTGNLYQDKSFLKCLFVTPMEKFYTYQTLSNKIVTKAVDNMAFYEEHNNDYEYLKNQYIANIFMDRSITHYTYYEMYNHYVNHDFSLFLVLLLVIYTTTNVFIIEQETEMDQIILTTCNGGRKTTVAKLLVVLSFVALLSLYFCALDFVAYSAFFGYPLNGFMPLYSLDMFLYSPLNISLIQFVALSALTKTLGIICISLIFLFISRNFHRVVLPYLINSLITVMMVFITDSTLGSNYVLRRVINPFVLLFNRDVYMKTEFVNVFGFPIQTYVAAIISGFVYIIIFAGLLILFASKNEYNKKGYLS